MGVGDWRAREWPAGLLFPSLSKTSFCPSCCLSCSNLSTIRSRTTVARCAQVADLCNSYITREALLKIAACHFEGSRVDGARKSQGGGTGISYIEMRTMRTAINGRHPALKESQQTTEIETEPIKYPDRRSQERVHLDLNCSLEMLLVPNQTADR